MDQNMRTKGRSQRTEQEKQLSDAIERAQSVEFYLNLNMLWPNIQQILLNLLEYVGMEISSKQEDKCLFDTILVDSKIKLEKAKKDGAIRLKGRDRDILVHFLREMLRSTARINHFRFSVNGKEWPSGKEKYSEWRIDHPGVLEVKSIETEGSSSKTTLRRIARQVLSDKDWMILDDDAVRLWSVDGAPIDPYEFDHEMELPENVVPFRSNLN